MPPIALTVAEDNAKQVREYLAWQRDVRRRRPSSVYDYATRLSQLLDHLGHKPMADVKLHDLEAWLLRQRGGRAVDGKAAPATIAKDAAVVRSMFRYLVGREHLAKDPSSLLVSPTIPARQPRAVPDEVWLDLWNSPSLTPERRSVLGLGFFIGLRRAEMVALKPEHFDLNEGRLVGFQRKGGGDDVTPYAEMLRVYEDNLPHLFGPCGATGFFEALHGHLESRSGENWLLGWDDAVRPDHRARRTHQLPDGAVNPGLLNHRLAKWLSDAGLPRTAFTCHALRHSAATNLLRAGVPVHLVSRLLNHTNITTTMGYVKAGGAELAEWRSSHGGLLRLSDYNRHG